jgi:hypothetical protein
MAIPTQPTATLITTEAYKIMGISSPTTAQITRATDYGMEIVKSDLKDLGLEWDFLRTTGYLVTTVGVGHVQLPTDFAKLISVRIMEGSHRGTASAGAASNITLESTYGGGSDTVGKYIVITGGTGSGQSRQIKSYDSSTRIATVDSAWTTNPDNTSTYLIVDTFRELDHKNLYEASSSLTLPNRPGSPQKAFIKSDAAEGDIYFDVTPDKLYGIQVEYYADILKVDLSSTLYSRILRLLNGLFIQGVLVWLLQDDARATLERSVYEKKKQQTAAIYLYPDNIANFHVGLNYE